MREDRHTIKVKLHGMEGMRREGVGLRKECTEGAGDGGLDGGDEAESGD